MQKRMGAYIAVLVLLGTAAHAFAGIEEEVLRPRVPPEHLAEARAMVNPVPATADSVSWGVELYQEIGCNGCHGDSGSLDGPAFAGMYPSPRNLTNGAWQSARTDGELYYVIVNGVEGTLMPPLREMLKTPEAPVVTDDDIWHVINFIRSLDRRKR